jgi:DNA-directed RNA polymerase subunit RPC12/RpoP
MPKIELDLNFVCARCKKSLESTQVYGTIVKVEPCPCLMKDYIKEQAAGEGRTYVQDRYKED